MKQVFLVLGFLYCFSEVMAQTPNPAYQNLIDVSTSSPEAASLGKFGNIPVSYNTGATSISIPVFEINVGKIKLPISFDYHTGGIRVDETASSVGIGWALSGIGMVSRNTVGLPDDQPGGYLYSPPFDSLYNDWAHAGGQYGATVDNTYATYLYGCRNGSQDWEPDIFSYSLNGGGGKFIYRKDGSLMQIPHTNNQILQPGGAGGNFRITDDNGIVYIFDQVEHSTLIDYATSPPSYISNWRLSKIIDPNTVDTIFFNYEAACTVNSEHFKNYTYTFATQTMSCTAVSTGENFHTTTINHSDELFLKEILWRGGKLSFVNTCDRQDKASEKRLNEVDVYANLKAGLQLIKIVKTYQSYFYSNLVGYTSTDERNYRLRLDSVGILPVNTSDQPIMYRMTYNAGPMASRESVAVDKWGFNNGQFGNNSLIPAQTVLYNSGYYNIGSANREPDSSSMLACMISSIQYPTGGKTVFEFEPHTYPTTQSYVQTKSWPLAAYGGVQSSTQSVFVPDSVGSTYLITYSFTPYNYSGVTDRPRITITDQVTGQQIFLSSNIDPSQGLNNSQSPSAWSPILGHTYLVVVNIYTTTASAVSASINIGWVDTYTNIPLIGKGGGLRVKTISNYDITGSLIGKDIYQYDFNQLLTPASYLLVTNESVVYKCSTSNTDGLGAVGCQYSNGGSGVIYHANSVYPATQFSGSPVLYGSVTKYQVDASGNTNGKSIYRYGVFDDQPAYASTDYSKVGVMLITNDWKNGYMTQQQDYRYNSATTGYDLIHWKLNNYQPSRQETLSGLKIKSAYNWIQMDCYALSMSAANTDYLLVQIPVYSGIMLLQSSSDTIWDTNGNRLGSTLTYAYNDLTHLNPTALSSVDSKMITTVQNYKYPHDLAATGNVYNSMLNRNMISAVVQSQKLYGGVQTALTNVNYGDWNGNATLLEPQTIDQQIAANPIETRIRFNKFDKYGNVIQQQKEKDVYQSYIWDYQSAYPIAKCMNADSSSIAYTSFEADGTGNWTIGAGTLGTTGGITGTNFYTLSSGATISKSGLSSTRNYLVTYWAKNGPLTISGTTATSGLVKRGWTFYQHNLPAASTSVSMTGAGVILDELRLYPTDAQMNTYTYAPLIGMTSSADPANLLSYYEYDGFNRLLHIRDIDSNILKKYEYKFQIYPTNAAVWQANGQLRCKPCPASASYITNMQQHQEIDVNPTSVTYNSNRWVDDSIPGSCVINPDWQNTTIAIRCQQSSGNNDGYQEQQQMDMNPCSSTYDSVRWVTLSLNTTACPLCNSSSCIGPSHKCFGNTCQTGTLGIVSQTQTGSGSTLQCTTQYGYFFSDGSYLLANRTVTSGQCLQQ